MLLFIQNRQHFFKWAVACINFQLFFCYQNRQKVIYWNEIPMRIRNCFFKTATHNITIFTHLSTLLRVAVHTSRHAAIRVNAPLAARTIYEHTFPLLCQIKTLISLPEFSS